MEGRTRDRLLDAVVAGRLDIVRDITAEATGLGIPTNSLAFDENGNTPLHLACKYGHMGILEFLTRSGADVDTRNAARETPLHLACANAHSALAIALMEDGCDVNAKSRNGTTAMYLAKRDDNDIVVRQLMRFGAREHDHGEPSQDVDDDLAYDAEQFRRRGSDNGGPMYGSGAGGKNGLEPLGLASELSLIQDERNGIDDDDNGGMPLFSEDASPEQIAASLQKCYDYEEEKDHQAKAISDMLTAEVASAKVTRTPIIEKETSRGRRKSICMDSLFKSVDDVGFVMNDDGALVVTNDGGTGVTIDGLAAGDILVEAASTDVYRLPLATVIDVIQADAQGNDVVLGVARGASAERLTNAPNNTDWTTVVSSVVRLSVPKGVLAQLPGWMPEDKAAEDYVVKSTPRGGEKVGVGIRFQRDANGTVVVKELVEGFSAARSQLVATGDVLVYIDECNVLPMRENVLELIGNMIRGEEGTAVTFGLLRGPEAVRLHNAGGAIGVAAAGGVHAFDTSLVRVTLERRPRDYAGHALSNIEYPTAQQAINASASATGSTGKKRKGKNDGCSVM